MLFIATPMYGGMCTAPYHRSTMALQRELTLAGIDVTWSTPTNESLITRARNNLVSEFLQTQHDYLFFIDADIEFSVKDVHLLWEMDKDVAVGAYRMKQDGAPLTVWKEGILYNIENETHPMKVDYAGTGFMMIKRAVIEKMIGIYKGTEYFEYIYTEEERAQIVAALHQVEKGDMTDLEYEQVIEDIRSRSDMERHKKYALFDTTIQKYYDGQHVYMSEDYTFCKRWRDIEGEIWCHPQIKLTHWGSKGYG